MEVIALLVIQLLTTAAAFAILWRKLDQLSGELSRVRRLLETLEMVRFTGAAARRAEPARAAAYATPATTSAPQTGDVARGEAWPRPSIRPARLEDATAPRLPLSRPVMANEEADDTPALWRTSVSPETGRVIAAATMSVAPALGFAFGAPAQAITAAGLSIAAALMLVSFRPLWRAAAWIGVLGASGWAVTAFALGSAQIAPLSFSVFTALAGAVGLTHARLRGVAPGASLALLMGAALLALGGDIGLATAPGICFGALALLAAVIGASSLRVEGLHVAAFLGIGFGLYVLSGQPAAAIWFTPATAWAGAAFFAISAIRAPMLGPRGVLLAGTGAASPILAAGALFASQHGLADRFAASGVFVSLTVMFFGLLAMCAHRGARGIAALKLTAWIIVAGAMVSAAFAAALSAPVAFVATVLAVLALGFVLFDQRYPDGLWRGAAIGALLGAGGAAFAAIYTGWPSLLTIAAAFALPALCAGLAAHLAQQRTPRTAAFLETFAIIAAVSGVIALMRVAFGAGAPNTAPLGFIEAGADVALLLAASLALAIRGGHGAQSVRRFAAMALALVAIVGSVVAGLLWLTPFWAGRPASSLDWAILQHAPLGFALPAVLAWTHWAFWRGRGRHLSARVALAFAALLTAAFITHEVLTARAGMGAPGVIDWIAIGTALLAFGLAIAVNFAPGVTTEPNQRSNLKEYFERNRRGEQRS